MTLPRLDLLHVQHRFNTLDVLADINLHVNAGEFVSLLGPSGAGKSTLFQILTGALTPDSGVMQLDGQPLNVQKGHFAFMPQRDALMPWRRIIDNATLGLEVQGMSRAAAREKVSALLMPFGLNGFEQQYPHQLSGGMRQRVALLRTVVQQRDMLLLDEPFGALDALTRTAMQQWLSGMWQQHHWTALLITHDVREAIFLSDRIYVLSARPARILHEFSVPLVRPRQLRDMALPAVASMEARLLEALLAGHTLSPSI